MIQATNSLKILISPNTERLLKITIYKLYHFMIKDKIVVNFNTNIMQKILKINFKILRNIFVNLFLSAY